MIKPHEDSAQITIPPPFVLLMCVVGMILLNVFTSQPFLKPGMRFLVGSGLLGVGTVGMFMSVSIFKKFKTGIPPWMPTTTIVEDGIYQFSRNPIYLSFMLIAASFPCFFNNAWDFIFLIPLFVFLNFYVIPNEEEYLLAKFGDLYSHYYDRTRRWI